MITITVLSLGLAIFTGQVIHQAYRRAYRRESQAFAFARVENVYPKFKHTP